MWATWVCAMARNQNKNKEEIIKINKKGKFQNVTVTKEQVSQRYDPKSGDKWKVRGGKSYTEGSEKWMKKLRKRGIIFIIFVPQGVTQP